MITIIAAMSRAPVDPTAPSGWLLALYTVGAIVGLVLAGRFILNPLFRLVGRLGERELFVVAGLFAVIASAALMHVLHLSTALGAFIAGVMLAESPYRHELESDVEPFRSILLGLFFLSVGMLIDFNAVAARPGIVVGLAVGIDRREGDPDRRAGLPVRDEEAAARSGSGCCSARRGEFGFVLFGQAAAAQLITHRGGVACSRRSSLCRWSRRRS